MKFISATIFLFLLWTASVLSQIPNGGFEDWEIQDSIENPVYWATNNYYTGYTPVLKTEEAIAGNYSVKISSTARDLNGLSTWPGCAHVKFIPSTYFQYMVASIRIDSIDEGQIEIRVKQHAGNGLYNKIGGWKQASVTNGVTNIWFPIDHTQLDTLLIEIWAFNKEEINQEFPIAYSGYSEAILDNLALTNTVQSEEASGESGVVWTLSPNPVKETFRLRLVSPLPGPYRLSIVNIRGQVLREFHFENLTEVQADVAGLPPGIYFIALSTNKIVLQRKKIVIIR